MLFVESERVAKANLKSYILQCSYPDGLMVNPAFNLDLAQALSDDMECTWENVAR